MVRSRPAAPSPDQSLLADVQRAQRDAMRAIEQKQEAWNHVMAMKYEPTVVTSSPVTNYSGSALTSSGLQR